MGRGNRLRCDDEQIVGGESGERQHRCDDQPSVTGQKDLDQ